MDLIDRQAAIDATAYGDPVCDVCRKAIMKVPSAERKRGKWIYQYRDGFGTLKGQCNQCGRTYSVDNFCAHCGADMRGEQDE